MRLIKCIRRRRALFLLFAFSFKAFKQQVYGSWRFAYDYFHAFAYLRRRARVSGI
jgi:hypothetical protein